MSFIFSPPKFVFGTRRADHLNGSDRDDIIFGFQGDDVISALGGNDLIHGDGGNDDIDAGAGNDIVLAGDGNDRVRAGEGSDVVDGGHGFDTVVYAGHIADHDISGPRGWFDRAWTVRAGDGSVDVLRGVEALHFEADDYTLYLDGRNNVVLAGDDTAATDEDTVLSIDAADLLANDQEFDGDTISVVAVSATSTAGASVSLANGQVSYDPGSLFQHLNVGESATDTFTYTVDDGKGGTDTATVTVTINGVNDAAAISGNDNGWVIEAAGSDAGKPTATGALTSADVDNGDGFQAISDGTSNFGYGTYSIGADGAWTYTLDNANAAVDALGEGETLTDTFTVRSEDGTEQDVTVVINGMNDAIAPRINEIHYDDAGTDVGEFVELRVAAGADVTGMLVELYNGSGTGAGTTYASTAVSGLAKTTDGTYDYYVWNRPTNGIQNDVDGVALSQNGSLIEFVSYEGTFAATNGAANGATSINIGVSEGSSTAEGQSLQRVDDRPGSWVGPIAETKGTANPAGGTPASLLISQIQGTGTASLMTSQYVLVSAIVTYTVADGFFLQEEDADADGNGATSEGIFVFTGGAHNVEAGDHVDVAGTVMESFGLTQIGGVTDIITLSTGNTQPSSANITLSPDFLNNFEQYEGMAIRLMSGTDDPLTVIENFNLARFGEVTLSAGTQVQPTQVLDPTTQLDEIHALQQANLNNRLTIDDGSSLQNPDEFRYVPATAEQGDNGNGYLDAGDDFSAAGPTLRLGSELTGPIEGVLTFNFGEYKMLLDSTLPVDLATNTGTRELEPADVGGRLTVSSFNLLNFFTTLNDGVSGGSGPNNLEPRGAETAFDFERQLDKIIEAMLTIDASVFGLQELENNGFDISDGSAIATLVDALNAAAAPGDTYAYVNPTAPGSDGFIGTDAITTGLIYKSNEVSLVASDTLAFSILDGQQQSRPAMAATFAEIGTNEEFTVVVNHLKSKSGTGPGANADQGDGQGAFNAIRTAHALELAAWLEAGNPNGYFAENGITDTDLLIIGDLNSYAQEDPVDALRDAGYVDLIDQFIGQGDAFSFIFDGQNGALDQGLASASLAGQVTGVTEWHINSPEPSLLSYSSVFKDPRFYNDDVFATSDHDPLIIGLNLGSDLVVA